MGDTSNSSPPRAHALTPATDAVAEYAATCIKYVETSTGVVLDFSLETLPLLDHYLLQARNPVTQRPEARELISVVAGCYFGEVIRRRHPFHWNTEAPEPLLWRLDWDAGPVAVFPVALARVAIEGASSEAKLEVFRFERAHQDLIAARLARLPDVPEDEYTTPSTRLEVLDIALDTITGTLDTN